MFPGHPQFILLKGKFVRGLSVYPGKRAENENEDMFFCR